jgi:uncharacterized membrane protein YdbT with pleckstrin-like domain
MALVPCPECAGQVSPSAVSCPHCGFPLQGAQAALGTAPTAVAGSGAGVATAEQVIWVGTPSLRAMAVDMVATGLYAAVVTAVVALAYEPALRFVAGLSRQAAAFVAEYEGGFKLAAILFVATVVGVRLTRLLWHALALRSHRYRVTSQRLLFESGVLSKSITEIDMRTVEDITLEQTVMQRLVGVGEIGIVSSDLGPGGGRARTRLRLLGVRDARAVRELVRNAAYQATSKQVFMRAT